MDAKAKVVATLRLTEFVSYHWETSVPVYEMPIGPYIPLTDHEAALAEQSERIEELQVLCNHLIAEKANAIAANATLLTGLEALAGEMRDDMEIFKGGVEGSWYRWRYDTLAVMEDRIRTLASSATGEKNTEEETKS